MAKKKTVTKRGRGRPKGTTGPYIPINENLLRNLASCGCSMEEIAAMLRDSGMQVCVKTIARRLKDPKYREQWENGIKVRDAKLRSRMWLQAMMMNGPGVHQAQFLAINYLGMTNKIEHSGQIDAHVEVESARDRLTRKLDTIAKRIARRAVGVAAEGTAALLKEPVSGGDGTT